MSENTVVISGKSYEISPLRLKHLKAITSMLGKPAPSAVYDSLERFFPFICASIQEKNPDFTIELIDEGTLEEINNAVNTIIDFSGIKIAPKGETKPATVNSTGVSSTDASAPLPAGTTA